MTEVDLQVALVQFVASLSRWWWRFRTVTPTGRGWRGARRAFGWVVAGMGRCDRWPSPLRSDRIQVVAVGRRRQRTSRRPRLLVHALGDVHHPHVRGARPHGRRASARRGVPRRRAADLPVVRVRDLACRRTGSAPPPRCRPSRKPRWRRRRRGSSGRSDRRRSCRCSPSAPAYPAMATQPRFGGLTVSSAVAWVRPDI